VKRALGVALRIAVAACCFAAAGGAQAHKSSDAYLQLRDDVHGLSLRVDIALRDLDVLLDLDRDGDGRLTWGEVRAGWPAIDAQVRSGVRLDGCELQVSERGLERRNDGAYAALQLVSGCRLADVRGLRYTLLRDVDPTHRGIVRITGDSGAAPQLLVLDPAAPGAVAIAPTLAVPRVTAGFFAEGMHHIATGYDHVLFLLCLLLPSVLRRVPGPTGRPRWRPVEGIAQAVLPVAGIVTAFTAAHSITLGLAAAKWVSLPASFIEPAIALTIVLAALDNLVPIFHGRRAFVTFAFGLIHGFGFAGVLGELNLAPLDFAWALLRFNLGIEAGQLGLVLAATALLYLLRERRGYPTWVIGGGSVAAMMVGALWLIERTAAVSLLPF
jgi:hypothetical protein